MEGKKLLFYIAHTHIQDREANAKAGGIWFHEFRSNGRKRDVFNQPDRDRVSEANEGGKRKKKKKRKKKRKKKKKKRKEKRKKKESRLALSFVERHPHVFSVSETVNVDISSSSVFLVSR